MDGQLVVLLGAAASLGLIHTILGPDHYLPFAALAKARSWSTRKLLAITVLCGIGHVLGSIVLGALGISLGWAIGSLEAFEHLRSDWAAWGLIGFGLAYGAWGIRHAFRMRPHSHPHVHADGTTHSHVHAHRALHSHVHEVTNGMSATPWVLFIVFVLGPCESLVPVLMVPASQHSWWDVAIVAGVFGIVTITTMCGMVLAMTYGLRLIPLGRVERWAHALAGFSLVACGGAIKWLGL